MKGVGGGDIETTGYEPFALHAPMQWAIHGYVTAEEGEIEWHRLLGIELGVKVANLNEGVYSSAAKRE